MHNARGKKKENKEIKSEVASSSSSDIEETSNSEAGDDVDNASEVDAADNPNSITCKLNTILSKLKDCPHTNEKVDITEINNRLNKLEKMLQKQYAMLKRLL